MTAAAVLAAAGVVAVTPTPAAAAPFQVSDDASFRSALFQMWLSSGPNVIEITADFTITAGGDPQYLGQQPLRIDGNDHVVSGDLAHRFLDNDTSQALTIEDLTFRNGRSTGIGGAIRAEGAVTVSGSTFTGNSAPAGGAIDAGGAVSIADSTFTDNSTTAGSGGAVRTDGSVTVAASTFSGNSAAGTDVDGGAIEVTGTATVTDSTFDHNTAPHRGGAFNAEATTVTATAFDHNTAGEGGAIRVINSATLTASTFANNTAASGGGGAIEASVSTAEDTDFDANSASTIGGAIRVRDHTTVTGSTFTGNTARAVGGAIRAEGLVAAENSTFTANTATTLPGGAVSALGAIRLVHATVVANNAGTGANLATGAGIESFGSVVASPLGGGGNCSTVGQSPTHHNATDDATCSFDDPTDQQIPASSVGLQAVADNGGPTPTLLPEATSPLVDAIAVAQCSADVLDDQRGLPRPADGDVDGTNGCDIGAVERQPPAARPDARARRSASRSLVGDDIYNRLIPQTVTGGGTRGHSVTYIVSVQNDAPFGDDLRILGQASTTAFRVVYRNTAGSDITRAVTHGTFTTPTLAPHAAQVIRVTVTVRRTAPRHAAAARTLTARSVANPTRSDTVRFTTRRT